MEIFDGRYYKSCKWFLKFTGLWPYNNDFKRRISHFSWYAINLTLFVPQLLKIMKEWTNVAIFFENVISTLFLLGTSAKYTVSYLSATRFKLLTIQIAEDWKKIIDKSEREILKKYNEQGRYLVLFYTFYVFGAWIIFALMPFVPYLLDKAFPLENSTRPLLMSTYGDYIFFEQLDYHYWICCHVSFVYIVSGFLFSGIDTFFVLTVKHTCGLFAVICYRMKNASKTEMYDVPINNFIKQTIVKKNLKAAITLHNETIRCSCLLEDSFGTCFLFVQTLCIVGLAMLAVYMLYIINNLCILLRICTIFLGLILHLLYINWVGQQIIDSSEKVFNSVYFSDWYFMSLETRKLIDIIMIRSLHPSKIIAGKISNLSMESLGMVLRSSASYFAVFLSIM